MIQLDVKRKLAYSQNPWIDYIEVVAEEKVDTDLLLQEFLPYKNKTFDSISNHVLVQKKYSLMEKGVYKDNINFMPYTKKVTETVQSILIYNSIWYRYVMPNTCYTWHLDNGKMCLHIPLETNEGCKFVYCDKVFSMPADGSLYLVNNSIKHTFVNAGQTPRLHITFEIL